ncbi:hypothetical protein K438DRAFT_1856947 [Mycena galopus ATCC 62051]|nr:hypothetical protein K438DRAFT_1856947 [Mycena galopus ATCC 62051]
MVVTRKTPVAPSPSGWIDRLVYLSLSLLALYAFAACPRDPTLSNPPYVLPPIYRALAHPSVAPYRTAPYVAAAKRTVWDRAAVPAFYIYVAPQYRKHVLPRWRKHVLPYWHRHVSPHIARATPYVVQVQYSLERTAFVLHKTYSTRVAPAVSRAYAFSKPYAIKGYRVARPHVVGFYVIVSDKAGAARRAYVDPHVVRIWEKVLELSGAGPVGSPTEQPPTAATTEDSTTEEVASETSVKATVTPIAASSSVASPPPSAEEEVPVPTETSSSSEAPVVAPSVTPVVTSSVEASFPSVAEASTPETTPTAAEPKVPAAIVEELSAASIAIQSAHGMESPVVEILADVDADGASLATLQALSRESNKQLRKTLVGLRKSAVSKMNDPRTEVGSAVPNVRKEGDKILAGLEGYLKKETAKASKGGDPVERAERWETVVKKVEEKLGESVQKAQGVADGMSIIQGMKTACAKHQADVGLELSWLADVTYLDWKEYHKMMHIGDDFQKEASEIQAGTHEHPPVDPFIQRLEEMQSELAELANELVERIDALKAQATKAFGLEPEPNPVAEAEVDVEREPEQEAEGEAEVEAHVAVEDEAKEPEVSILPVVDPAQVIIGKSAEQVKEAIRIADEHKEL